MQRPAGPNWLPRAFVHPLWWSALGLLLLNDHVFKHAGVLPGALTGKLSDFAGMLVAPPLLALLLGARRPRGAFGGHAPALRGGAFGGHAPALRGGAFSGHAPALRGGAFSGYAPALRGGAPFIASASVGLGLCAIKLFPPAALALEHVMKLLGVRSHFCVDPTDLWALLVLPFGHALCAAAPLPASNRARSFAARAGIAIAAAACVATGGSNDDDDNRDDAPFIVNKTDEPLTLIITSTEGQGGCRIYRDDRIGLLTQDAFGAPREITLKAGDDAELLSDPKTTACGAASIALASGEHARVFWRELDKIEGFVPADDDQRLARRLVIEGKQGSLKFQPGDDLSEFDLGDDAPEPTCSEPEPTDPLTFTWLPMAQGFLEVGELRRADDGCLEVDWFEGEGDTKADTQRLCIPEWAFPFKEDETLSVVQSSGEDGARSLRITRFDGSKVDTQLEIWNDSSEFEGSQVKSLSAIDCVGQLSSCGAYVRPVQVSVRGNDDALNAGADVEVSAKNDVQVHVLIGTARDVAWTSGTCSGPDTRLGASANVLELREY